MTDIKEPINTTSDGTVLSVVCENPEKSVVGQKLEGCGPPAPPKNYPPVNVYRNSRNELARPVMGTIFLVYIYMCVCRMSN